MSKITKEYLCNAALTCSELADYLEKRSYGYLDSIINSLNQSATFIKTTYVLWGETDVENSKTKTTN